MSLLAQGFSAASIDFEWNGEAIMLNNTPSVATPAAARVSPASGADGAPSPPPSDAPLARRTRSRYSLRDRNTDDLETALDDWLNTLGGEEPVEDDGTAGEDEEDDEQELEDGGLDADDFFELFVTSLNDSATDHAAAEAEAEAEADLVPEGEVAGPPPEEALAPAEAVAAQMIVPLQPWHGGHY